MNSPQILKLELNESCNGHCIFCNVGKMSGAIMPLSVYKQVIDAFPEVIEVQPQFFGEPLLHPKFVEAIKYAKDNGKRVVFYTNGILLRGKLANRIAEAIPDRVIISVEADNKELYNDLRPGLDFDLLVANITEFKEKKSTKTALEVRMTVCKENRKFIDRIKAFWRPRVDGIYTAPELPFVRKFPVRYAKGHCTRPMEQMVIKATGAVVLCCTDLYGSYPVGHIRDGARKIWGNSQMTALRNQINSPNPPALCKECGFFIVRGE